MGSCCCRKRTIFILFVLGIPLLIAGIIVAALGSFKSLGEDEIKKSLPLKSGSKSFENWEKPKGQLFMKYYVFNVTSTSNANGRIPEISQLGPYTYREVIFNNVTKMEGQTITYVPNSKYYFDRASSCQNCDPIMDQVVTINYPLLVVLKGLSVKYKNLPTYITKTIQILKYLNINLFQTRSVHQLLWGYKDPAFEKFINRTGGWYALQINNSGNGITKIYSGKSDVNRVAKYIEWRGYEKLPWWNSDFANAINGTDARQFKPLVDKEDSLFVVVPEICRSVKLTYDTTIKVYDIELYRYTIRKEVFESGDVNPDKKGFCVTGPDKKCLPSGLLDINACKGGPRAPPFVASPPLFYLGEPQLAQHFNLYPQKKLHATFIDVEPNTGLTMQGYKRLQLNLAVTNFTILGLLRNVHLSNTTFFPIFYSEKNGGHLETYLSAIPFSHDHPGWVLNCVHTYVIYRLEVRAGNDLPEEIFFYADIAKTSAVISEDDADKFKKKVLLPLKVTEAVPYAMIALGGLLLLIALMIAVFLYKKMKRHGNMNSLPLR